jgi:hypothetical protein
MQLSGCGGAALELVEEPLVARDEIDALGEVNHALS